MPLYSALICISTNKQKKLGGSLRKIQLRLKENNTTSLETNYISIYIYRDVYIYIYSSICFQAKACEYY